MSTDVAKDTVTTATNYRKLQYQDNDRNQANVANALLNFYQPFNETLGP